MDTFCLIFINTISLIVFFIFLVFWKNVRKKFLSPEIFDLVAFITSFKIFSFFFLPAVFRAYSDWAQDRMIGATPAEIATVYAIEFVSLCVWMFILLVTLSMIKFGRPFVGTQLSERGIIIPNNTSIITENTAKLFMIVICLLYLFFFPYTFEDILKSVQGESSLIQPVVFLAGPVIGIFLFFHGRKVIGNIAFGLGTLVAIIGVGVGFASGSRGQVMFAALWFIYLHFFVKRKKIIMYLFIAGILVIFFAHNVMTTIRAQEDFMRSSYQEQLAIMITGLSAMDDKSNLLSSIEFRFGEASRISVGFLRLVDEGKRAWFKPVLASMYAPIPRRYFLDKPVQGSFDGTKEGMGMYIVQNVMRSSTTTMSDFFTGVHAYWELGLPGVFLFSSLSGIFIALCIGYFGILGLAGLPLMMIVLKPPWLEPKLWISETIADVFHTLIPLIFLWYLIKLLIIMYVKWGQNFASGCHEAKRLMN